MGGDFPPGGCGVGPKVGNYGRNGGDKLIGGCGEAELCGKRICGLVEVVAEGVESGESGWRGVKGGVVRAVDLVSSCERPTEMIRKGALGGQENKGKGIAGEEA